MVASSSNTQYGTHCNDVVSAETVMMLKEHIVETYGPIRYTQATGGSGGAHLQNLIASNYPGLLQGIIPSQHFQDTWTSYREFADCGLLARFYAAEGYGWRAVVRSAEGDDRWARQRQYLRGPDQHVHGVSHVGVSQSGGLTRL